MAVSQTAQLPLRHESRHPLSGPAHRIGVPWSSPPYATFEALAPALEAKWGPPIARDLDSNGLGLFDCHRLQFPCGLEVALWRFHCTPDLQRIDAAHEPSPYEIHANQPDLAHIVFHLDLPPHAVHPTTTAAGAPLIAPIKPSLILMRQDDNGNRYEVVRVTSDCEAESLLHRYEATGHKQLYWIVFAGS